MATNSINPDFKHRPTLDLSFERREDIRRSLDTPSPESRLKRIFNSMRKKAKHATTPPSLTRRHTVSTFPSLHETSFSRTSKESHISSRVHSSANSPDGSQLDALATQFARVKYNIREANKEFHIRNLKDRLIDLGPKSLSESEVGEIVHALTHTESFILFQDDLEKISTQLAPINKRASDLITARLSGTPKIHSFMYLTMLKTAIFSDLQKTPHLREIVHDRIRESMKELEQLQDRLTADSAGAGVRSY